MVQSLDELEKEVMGLRKKADEKKKHVSLLAEKDKLAGNVELADKYIAAKEKEQAFNNSKMGKFFKGLGNALDSGRSFVDKAGSVAASNAKAKGVKSKSVNIFGEPLDY